MCEKMILVDVLISDIQGGKYKPNDKLPSENQLAEQFQVPRMIVRKAYERLQELGFIYSRQGKGSYVQNQKLQIPLILSGDISFSEKMRELEFDFETVNLCCEKIDYDSKVYHKLQAKPEEHIYKISRLRIVDDVPVAIHTSYVSQEVFGNVDEVGEEITSIFHFYKSQGYRDFMGLRSHLSVVFPNQEERSILKCTSLVPLILLESGCVDQATGTVLEYTKIHYRSDCFTYVI